MPSLLSLLLDLVCSHAAIVVPQGVIGLAEIHIPVRIRAILSKFAMAFLFIIFTSLCLEIVVGDVEHLHLDLEGEGLESKY